MLTTCRSRYGHLLRTLVTCGAICASIAADNLNGSTASSEISMHASLINRDHKGDRMPLVPAVPLSADKQSRQNTLHADPARKLPDGCESAVSPIVNKRLARIASRCIS